MTLARAAAEELLAAAELYWITSVRSDGRPHVTPLVGQRCGSHDGHEWLELGHRRGGRGAGHPSWAYRVDQTKVLVFAKDPHGQTSFRF